MHLKTKLVGVTHTNPDGTDRQRILFEDVTAYSDIYLKREPDNPHDENAVAVYLGGQDVQLGFINSQLAPEVSEKLDNGVPLRITDFEVTGGEHGKTLGLNIEISSEGSTLRERLEEKDKKRRAYGAVVLGVMGAGVAAFGYFIYWVFSFF